MDMSHFDHCPRFDSLLENVFLPVVIVAASTSDQQGLQRFRFGGLLCVHGNWKTGCSQKEKQEAGRTIHQFTL